MHTLGAQSQLNGRIIWSRHRRSSGRSLGAGNGFDAVVSRNTFDPGVDGGRLAANMPVIGPLGRHACGAHSGR